MKKKNGLQIINCYRCAFHKYKHCYEICYAYATFYSRRIYPQCIDNPVY